MTTKTFSSAIASALVLCASCSSSGEVGDPIGSGGQSAGGTGAGAGAAAAGAGGTTATSTAGTGAATAGASASSAGTNGGARAGTGGANAGQGASGSSGRAGAAAGGAGAAGGTDADPGPIDYELDCGQAAIVLEGHGPPSNRVNYVIVGDGYTEADLETTYVEHLEEMLSSRFTAEFEPYLRYRNFINICALKVPSAQSGVGTSPGNTAFDGYGNDESRLGYINDDKVNQAIESMLPAEIEVDWKGVVLNGNRWWNSGGRIMVWSGAHMDAALAAEHEGGHSFLRLADEYGGNCTFSGSEDRLRINMTMDPVNTAGKWTQWLEFDQSPGTGVQGTFEGGEYCDRGVWRPSEESVMNMLWDSPYYNAISREQAIRIIYDIVRPIDSSTPPGTTDADKLEVKVVDPAVLKVDWSVDGEVVASDAGGSFDVAAQQLSSGTHTIAARAYDDTDWVRGDREELEQTVEWTVTVP